jgi:PAS domain S-box-containing protein
MWTRVALGYVILYLLTMTLLPAGSEFRNAVGLVAFLPVSLGLAAAFFSASRSARDPEFRRGFLGYALSFGVTGIGTAIWAWQQEWLHIDPTYSWSNLPYLLSYPLAIAGMFALPTYRTAVSRRWRFVLDAGIAVIAGAAITWIYVVVPVARVDQDLGHRILLLAYPIGDLIIFAVLVPMLLGQRRAESGVVIRLLAGGQMIYLAGDLGYQLSGEALPWLPFQWPDLPFLAGYVIMMWAAETFHRSPVEILPTGRMEEARPLPRNLLPLLLGAVIYVLLLVAALRHWTPELSVLAVSAVATTTLILLRERLTDRQNLELASQLADQRGEARFRAIIGHLHVGVMVQDAQTRVVTANAAALELLGLAEDEMLRRTVLDPAWNVIRDDGTDMPGEMHPVSLAIASRKPVRNVVMGVLRPRTRDRVWLLVSAEPQLTAEGTIREVFCTFHDVTERRELEAQLRQSHRMEAVGQLAGGVAHDFNNLLTAITGYADLLRSNFGPGDPRGEDVAEIGKAANRAAALTRQLLAFGRRQLLQPVVLDVNAVVHDAERLLRRLLGEDIAIRSALAPDLGQVRVDRGQLEQVIVNLAVNARDAMPTGGALTITTRNARPDSAGMPSGLEVPTDGLVLLEIRDTGTGMEEATRLRAFEPFFTTKEVGKGTGLGLSTVYGIVRQSGGDVWIDSAPGRGTVVTVALPRVPAGVAVEPVEAAEAPLIPGGRERVLIVEDEPAIRAVVRRALTVRGYSVLDAADPAEARTVLTTALPAVQLLITDVVMPGGSGPDLAAWARERWPGLPVLFITGHADEATLRHGLDLANATLLPKPFSAEQIVLAARAALDATP